ncbi:hypothetical protein BX666DRAFT_872855 [Dichotomocladium elegans]|nr:hypothetical protein BX666DRAFT_872855 [Dichotomocladium elegans]
MDISALCSNDSDGIETLPASSSPAVSCPLESEALVSESYDDRSHGIDELPASCRISPDSMQLAHIGCSPPRAVLSRSRLSAPTAQRTCVNSTSEQLDSFPIQNGLSLSPSLHSPQPRCLLQQQQQQQQQSLVILPSSSATIPRSSSTTVVLTADGLSHLIGQCAILCEELDRCRDQDSRSRSEIERQQLLDSAAKTAKKLLGSLTHLEEKERTQIDNSESTRLPCKRSADFIIEEQDAQETEYLHIRRAAQVSQDSIRQKVKRRTKRSTAGQRCHSCHTTETPEWRRGPDGARTLCNACGLHYSKLLRKDALTVQSDRKSLLGGTTKINTLPAVQANPRLVHYPIIQVQARPIGNKTSDGVRFINSQISFPRQGESLKSHSGALSLSPHT